MIDFALLPSLPAVSKRESLSTTAFEYPSLPGGTLFGTSTPVHPVASPLPIFEICISSKYGLAVDFLRQCFIKIRNDSISSGTTSWHEIHSAFDFIEIGPFPSQR